MPKAVGNAVNALRKHRDPARAVVTTPYRAALPYVAAAIADPCLERTIELLGEHSDDPTRAQLLAALDELGDEFPTATVAVMLASVADAGMPASDLCFGLLDTESRFGLTGWAAFDPTPVPRSASRPDAGLTPEQRQERRQKKRARRRGAPEEAGGRPAGGRTGPPGQETERSPPAGGATTPPTAPGPAVRGAAPRSPGAPPSHRCRRRSSTATIPG